MPDEHGIPTDEEIDKWRARWIGENAYRVDDVVRILQEDPEWGSKKIVELPWYTWENGFESPRGWEFILQCLMETRRILDLRRIEIGKGTKLQGVVLTNSHLEASVLSGVDLSGANLEGVKFWRVNLQEANLSGAKLRGADLLRARLHRATLPEAYLEKAKLLGANLQGADLTRTVFSGGDLREVDLTPALVMRTESLQEYAPTKLSETDLRDATLLNAKIRGVRFIDCKLRGIDLRSFEGYAKCDPDTFFGRTKGKRKKKTPWLFNKRILKEQNLEPKEARNICSEIRLCFRDNGLFHNAAIYYEQEEYWRTRVKLRGSLKNKVLGALRLLFFEWMIGYGERPQRIIAWSFGILVFCALIFCGGGFQYETSPGVFESMRFPFFEPFSGEGWMNFLRCLRFSIENFTTLGFSMMRPAECNHWVASLEGIVGVLFVALATVTWARKAIRD